MLLFIPWGSCKDSLTHFHSTLRQLTPPQNNCRLRHPHQNRNRNRNQPRRPNLRLYPQFHTHLHRTLTWHHRRMSTGAGAGNPKNNRPIDPLLKRQHHSSPVSPGYWKTTVLSGAHMEEPEIPLVTVTQPRMAKKLSELAHGQIQITSGWEIHSTRNSARVERDSLRRG